MSVTSPSHALGSANETVPVSSLLANEEGNRSTVEPRAPYISALAIEAHLGRFGCAVFVEEEHQLLLCEDLPCDFAFDDRDQLPSVRNAEDQSEQHNDDQEEGRAAAIQPMLTIAAFGQTPLSVIESLLLQFNPELIVSSSRCPESFVTMLRKYAEQTNGTVEVRPARDFQLSLGLSSIEETTMFGNAPSAFRRSSDYASLEDGSMAGLVVLDAKVAISKSALSISAVGPLLSSLRSRRDLVSQSLTVASLCLDDFLFVDENTLKSLGICSSDVHGFVHAKAGREGFSILVSQPLLRRWILLPLAQRAKIERRHQAVELLVRQESAAEVIQIRCKLAELGSLPQLCSTLNMGVGSVYTWEKLLRTCNAVARIRAELNSMDLAMSEMIREVREQLSVDRLVHLADMIQHTQGRTAVLPGVDTHLDDLREQHRTLPALLDGVAAELRREAAFRLHVVYFPQIGYLIVVPGGEIVNMMADTSLEQQFASDESVYLKNSRMTDLDQHLGDLASFVVDREIDIIDGLQALVKECSPTLLAAHFALSQLDCLVAFARAATLYDLRRPALIDEQVIRLKGSRHALKALSDDSFVPNDLDLRGGVGLTATAMKAASEGDAREALQGVETSAGVNAAHGKGVEDGINTVPSADVNAKSVIDDGPKRSSASQQEPAAPAQRLDERYSVMVLTGANSSGKSCLLQQAALAVFMSQCGSFVPAAHAELGVFDKILTRMRQDESVASEGSSFTRELGRLHRAIAMSTKRSLVILDEVGRECRSDGRNFGTDGAGLFIATIHEFLERGRDCPIIVSATHHLRDLPIQRAHMQTILLPINNTDRYSSLTYLYRLKPGFAGTSHACHCARLCGVPESVVERADRICRIGLKAWRDQEAVRDEAVVRRLLQLELGNDGEEGDRMAKRVMLPDEEVKDLLRWVLHGEDEQIVQLDGDDDNRELE
ncbi:related to MutS protein homolog 5 [Melanopsichium pennsylvanicum]|uniref:Related to MutS protein homolog 5 n=1 Tax=Melanopsichium pennsylvanicum TaxID=63383 RepID=A0AAJ4XGN2_9BASI|nr:related to MutS protein homolog 5 [Melanopsichium pennsylvanicum]